MTLEDRAFQMMLALVAASDRAIAPDAEILASRAYHLAHAFADETKKRGGGMARVSGHRPSGTSPSMAYAGDKEDWISYADQQKV